MIGLAGTKSRIAALDYCLDWHNLSTLTQRLMKDGK
jgi:hypothetical protein